MNGMKTIQIKDIEENPRLLLELIKGGGEPFQIVDGDWTLADVRPHLPRRTEPRPAGLAAGEFNVPDDFDDPLPEEVLKSFSGGK
jgi:antitoxin (DNA-binding transcriptional repressor) of toxin-antitoxin stability system